ncbi:hypothetical protein V502_10360 [Pseudogymnoascus sp. VKM F-4520 (FW-2644)]|nr:hypothetical protein V502_10360 [Pseudogymnoascus sp. VKM F-4520 (FW-2644)]
MFGTNPRVRVNYYYIPPIPRFSYWSTLLSHEIPTATDKGRHRVTSSSKPTKNIKQIGQRSKPPKVRETSAQLQRYLDEEDADYKSLAIPGSESHHKTAKEERRKAINEAVAREY